MFPKLTLPQNRSRSSQGHHLSNYGGLVSPLHTKFRGNRPTGSAEDFEGLFLPSLTKFEFQ